VWNCKTKDGYMCGCKQQRPTRPTRPNGRRGGKGMGMGMGMGKGKGGGRFVAGHRRQTTGEDEGAVTVSGIGSAGGGIGSAGAGIGSAGGDSAARGAVPGGVPSSDGRVCPAGGDLEDPAQLDAMLAARANAEKDVVITILGPTSGTLTLT
jgi:hypothetical protein